MKAAVRWRERALVLLLVVGWFSANTNRGTFPDPDAYYHAHLAAIELDRGAIQTFPWLDLTSVGQYPADRYYVYHRLLGPAIVWAPAIGWRADAETPAHDCRRAGVRAISVLSLPLLATLVAALRSRRFFEYLLPTLAMWTTAEGLQ